MSTPADKVNPAAAAAPGREPSWEEAHARLEATLNALPDLLFVLDRDGRIYDYHAPQLDRLYVPPEQFLGRTMDEVLPEPAVSIVNRAIRDAVAHGHHSGSIYPLPTSGGPRWFEISIAAQGDPQTPAGRLVAIVRDITERKRAETALRESEERFAQNARQTRTFVWELDDQGLYTFISPAVEDVLGYRPEEIIGKLHFYDLYPADGRAAYQQAVFAAAREGGPFRNFENPMVAKDGRIVWVSTNASPLLGPDGALRGYRGSDTDITRRKLTELALQASEARFADTTKASRSYVWEVDSDGLITFVSPMVSEVLGYRPEELAGHRHFYDLVPEEEREQIKQAGLDLMARREAIHSFENRNVTKDGRRIWLSTSASPAYDAAGTYRGYQGIDTDITPRKQAEEALRESEARIRSIQDNLPQGLIYHVDTGTDGRERHIIYMSQGVEALHGVSAEAALRDAQAIYGQFLEEDRERVAQAEARAVESMTPFVQEVRVRLPSGEVRWRRFTSAPRRLSNGHLVWDGIETDITDRKQAELALRESEARFRELYELMRDGLALMDMAGCFMSCNPAFEALLGYREEELRGKHFREITPPGWEAVDAEGARQVMQQGFSAAMEKAYLRKNGTVVPVELVGSLLRDTQGRPSGILVVARDITERKMVEEALLQARDELERRVLARTAELEKSRAALARSEEQFRQMAESIQEVFYLLDAQTLEVLYASPAYKTIWGQPDWVDQPRFEDWAGAMHPDDRERNVREFQAGVATGEFKLQEYRIVRPDGGVRWIADQSWPIRDAQGRMIRIAGVIRDITEHRRLEAEILRAAEAERRRMGRDLHDSLGQSLTAIGYLADAVRADLARRKQPEAKEVQKLEKLIAQAAAEAHGLARGLLLADLQRGGLAAALQELAFRIRERFGIACRYEGPARIPKIGPETAAQLYRIAQEAATYAAKYGKRTEIDIRLARESAGLQLSVQDTGPGLPARRARDAGIGLDIMRYRASMIGAVFWIESVKGKGTTVNCLVPGTAAPRRKKR